MKSKRLASLALAAVMTASLAVPAFATSKNSTKITGTYSEPVISVTVPTTGAAQINPLGLDVKLDDDSKITGQQIVTKPLALINKSDMKLDVTATVTGEVKGNFKFATETTVTEGDAAPVTTNSGFVFLEMKASALANADLDATEAGVCGLDAAKLNAEVAKWDAAEYDASKHLLVGTKAASLDKMVTLAAAEVDGEEVTVKEGGVALFRLTGDLVEEPKTAWAKTDGFTATVAFTFKPAKDAGNA